MGAHFPIRDRIVEELVAKTRVYCSFSDEAPSLQVPEKDVTLEELQGIPEAIRPQLTGSLMRKHCEHPSYPTLLSYYSEYMASPASKNGKMAYHRFRQGLDILDLDYITYLMLEQNPNAMGYWLPKLVKACKNQTFLKIPKTRTAKVPLPLLQLTRLDYGMLTAGTLDVVNRWAQKVFCLEPDGDYFIKTGTYSSKFDFRNAHVTTPKEVGELGEYLLFINNTAVQMAGPLTQPSIYGMSTTNEWVVREYIKDVEGNPTIYKGLPLHTEFRVFVDCDHNQVLSIVPYWEPETMKNRFTGQEDANSPHQVHDYIIYCAHEEILMQRFYENCNRVTAAAADILPFLDLGGQWSLDVMQNGDDFWIIDMATAESSAFYESVPEELRNPKKEDWLPRLRGGKETQ